MPHTGEVVAMADAWHLSGRDFIGRDFIGRDFTGRDFTGRDFTGRNKGRLIRSLFLARASVSLHACCPTWSGSVQWMSGP